MIVFVVARTVPIISSNNGRQRSHIVGHVCLIFATIASSLLLAARLAMQLFQSAANCSFPLLFLQSAFLLTTWPTNRLQIERKPATSYAPALPCPALPGSLKSLLPTAITPFPSPPRPINWASLLAISGSVGGIVPCPWLSPFQHLLLFGGSRPFVAALPFYVLRFTFSFRPSTGPGAGLRSCAQFFLCFAV